MTYVEEILRKLGWNDGFHIPVANAENQALEQELAKLTMQKIKSKVAWENTCTRLENLRDHFKFVNQENDYTQKLITAHKQQYDSEANQYQSLKGEKSKMEQDIGKVKKHIKFLEEEKEAKRKKLEKAVIKVDRIKQETGWDIEALKAWEEALKKRDDDNELIQKFSKEDERRFSGLEARRAFLQGEYDSKNLILGKMVCDLHSCDMIIERTGKAIKQQIDERESLIKQWKDSVKMLQQRDAEIETGQERILEADEVLKKQNEHIEEENKMLSNQQRNNHELELEIEKLNASSSGLKGELSDLQQSLFAIGNECQAVKREVTTSANNLEKLRIQNRLLDNKIDQEERRCIKGRQDTEAIQEKINEMKSSNVSSAERIKKIQKMIEMVEKECAVLISDTEKINSNLFRTDQQLKDQQALGKTLETQINNTYCISNKLRKHIRDDKKILEKLKESVYDMQFRIDELKQRLCKLEGSHKSNKHADEREEKIKELEKTLADHMEVQHTLQRQVDRLQDEMRKLSNFIDLDREQIDIVKNQVETNLMIYDIGRKQIVFAKKSTQEKQVEENIMQLRINHIENEMRKEDRRIFNLQRLRVTLDQVTKERNLEIDTKKAVVLAKKRHLDEERRRLAGDISIRKVKIQQLQKKYHTELMALGKNDHGQPISLTHFKVKNAQEKFFLQQQGDELDQKIKVAEKEIVAIENTLKMVNLTNVAFKNNLSAVKEDDEEIQEMKELNNLYKEWILNCRKTRQKLDNQQAAYDELVAILNDELRPARAEKKQIIQKLEEENLFIEKQQRDKEEKLQRAQEQLRKALKKLGTRDVTIYEQDLEVRQLRDGNNTVLKRLNSIANECTEVAPNINKYSAEYSINLKSQSSLSSNTFSTQSSISSGSSARSLVAQMEHIMVKTIDISFKEN
ncbi:coiled-coil domain-containing protein 39-like [Euwallacea similis]|uniref:coiled-coil domain-containing protein 39-like n=1 Tax=Euwallacea similis TaxID=1736056 RepID=UPI00344BE134